MKIVAVTTFSERGYKAYGQNMMATFDAHWSMGVPLIVYKENWEPTAAERRMNMRFPDLPIVSPWLLDFKARNARKNNSNGFRFDVIRFAHKVAALTHADLDDSIDYLIWLDGDIVTHSDFHEDDLLALLPTNSWLAWLDRGRFYPECGFYIVNRRHPQHMPCMTMFRRMYTKDAYLEYKEWHDSWLLQCVVQKMQAPVQSLSGDGYKTHHPLVNGPLGQWFDHLKGARKAMGKTPKRDLLIKRTEDYWQGKTA